MNCLHVNGKMIVLQIKPTQAGLQAKLKLPEVLKTPMSKAYGWNKLKNRKNSLLRRASSCDVIHMQSVFPFLQTHKVKLIQLLRRPRACSSLLPLFSD